MTSSPPSKSLSTEAGNKTNISEMFDEIAHQQDLIMHASHQQTAGKTNQIWQVKPFLSLGLCLKLIICSHKASWTHHYLKKFNQWRYNLCLGLFGQIFLSSRSHWEAGRMCPHTDWCRDLTDRKEPPTRRWEWRVKRHLKENFHFHLCICRDLIILKNFR